MPEETKIRTQLEADTRALALPEGRRVGDPGHDVAREYLLGRMEEIGLAPFHGESFELPYTATVPLPRAPKFHGVVDGEVNLPASLPGAVYVGDTVLVDDHGSFTLHVFAEDKKIGIPGWIPLAYSAVPIS